MFISFSPAQKKALAIAAVFALLLIVWAAVDLAKRFPAERPVTTRQELQDLALVEDHQRIRGPNERFSMVKPPHWEATRHRDGSPYSMLLRSPNGPMIEIMASEVDYRDFSTLLRKIEQQQTDLGLNMNIEPDTFKERPAVRRTVHLHEIQVFSIDFLDEYIAHHIRISIPHDLVDQYRRPLEELVAEYRPLQPREAAD